MVGSRICERKAPMSTVKRIQSVYNACRVFEAVAATDAIGVSELSREVHLDKSGVQRILLTLHDVGWLQPSTDRITKWQVSSKMLAMSRTGAVTRTIETAAPVIRSLRDATGETVLLIAPQAGQLVVVDVAGSAATVASMANLGDVMPAYGASASAWFGALPPGATGGRSVVAGSGVNSELIEAARDKGFAVYSDKDVTSIGAAIIDASGLPTAVIVVLIPDFRSAGKVDTFADTIRLAAQQVSQM